MAVWNSKKQIETALRRARQEYAASRQEVFRVTRAKEGKDAILKAEKFRDEKLKKCVELQNILDRF